MGLRLRLRLRLRLTGGAVIATILVGCSLLPSAPAPEVLTATPVTWLPTTPPSSPTFPAGPTAAAARALNQLARLPIGEWAPATGYDRDASGQRWSDDIDVDGGHNGCDQRPDALRRDLQDIVIKPRTQGCVPAAGTRLVPPRSGVDRTRPGSTTRM